MKIVKLHKYKRADGGTTVSPIEPDVEYIEACRLVADKGKALTKDGKEFTPCADVDSADGWREVDDPEMEVANE